MVGGTEVRQTLELANTYASEAAKYTQELQKKEASEVNQTLTNQLATLDKDMENLTKILVTAPAAAAQMPAQRNSRLFDALQAARDDLLRLPLVNYTDLHPDVIKKKAQIAALEKQLTDANRAAAQPATDR